MRELSVDFTFKARYFRLGEINPQTKAVWFVLHGYGHLAQYFIAKFKSLESHGVCVIAPEGLSRFYLEDVNTRNQTGNNRVGATWMTRENRLMDIENYLSFLDTVYQAEIGNRSLPVTILGFSQGAATASRWSVQSNIKYERLILWSGIFPNDMDFEKSKEVLKAKQVVQVYGSKDPFLNDARIGEMKDLAQKLGVTTPPIVFDGGHEIHEQMLIKFA
ncbi:MAG TPA: alpha/beta hydrolase [Cyclobacteriaceae bacterium]|nr:alpha/beta hydrolase [Cyclobacteriaceae bacterium]